MDGEKKQTCKAVEKHDEDMISKLPDDIIVQILSMCPYIDAVRTAVVSRRWEHLHTQLPSVQLVMSWLGLCASLGEPSEQRVQSLERTLRRRCHDGGCHTIKKLWIAYRMDVPFECQYVDDFIVLANASRLELHVQCKPLVFPDEDAGEWSLELPPPTTELQVSPYWYAVRLPRVHGPGVNFLRWLALDGRAVLRQEFLDTVFPSLEELHIVDCTLPASIDITSDTMPRLKHLRIADVDVLNDTTKAAITVTADELTTLRVSCSCQTEPMSSGPGWGVSPSRFRAVFTRYSCFRLRAPKLRVFDWRCCYADEVRVDSVGCLSDVVVQLAAGRLPRLPRQVSTSLSMQDCDKQMKGILRGLMPGLRPHSWHYGPVWLSSSFSCTLLELELSQTVSAPPELGVELGGALPQNVLELWSWV